MSEKWSWCCSKCDKSGPYKGSDCKYPRGWRFNLTQGLVCDRCAKKFNIKTSDVEKEVEKAYKKSWESL